MIEFSFSPDLERREEGDLLILPFWEGGRAAFHHHGPFQRAFATALSTGDFKGKGGEGLLLYIDEGKERRLLLLGLGRAEAVSVEGLRRFYASAVRIAQSKKVKTLNLLFPALEKVGKSDALRGIAEGVLLANYAFCHFKEESLRESSFALLEKVQWIGVEKGETAVLQRVSTVSSAVHFARELVNGNADDVTPRYLAEMALSLATRSSKLKATLFDKGKLEREKMGLLLAVGRGASTDPFLIQLAYEGNPQSKEHIVLIGKGITYDTGGLKLKTLDGMMTMKSDMAGAAAVMGAVQAASALDLKVNVTAVVPAAENSIDSKSYKLGDVYRAFSGKTVEINNTDAEGRLVIADAIAFAARHLHPTCLIDLGTLTGGAVVALGEEIAPLFSNSDSLCQELLVSSAHTGESLWRMPLPVEYRDSLKSDIADLVNVGGSDGTAIKGALFIQEFVPPSIAWAHLDIAGPAYWTRPRYYHTAKATGFGVRLLVDFLEKRGGA